MNKQLVLSSLAATAVMLASGAAFPASVITLPAAEITEYSQTTHELFTSVSGVIDLFLHEPGTVHLPAIFGPKSHPPDPCYGLALTWDTVVFADAITRTENTAAFEALLVLMAGFQCKAEITTDVEPSGSTPTPIVSMLPVLQ